MDRRRICVVGAGVSGLCTCRHLLDRGFDPVVLDADADIGGVWRTAAVSITKLQTPSAAYQYSDFPWPQGSPEYPSARQVLEYLDSYARHFGIWDKIKFNTRVVSIRKQSSQPDGKNLGIWGDDVRSWEVTVQNEQEATREVLEFDFVILCIGRFGDVPNLPVFPEGKGAEVFRGRVLHSLDYSKLNKESMAGKRVVVVGFSKSALDIAMEVATVNQGAHPCTLLFRKPNWIVSDWKMFRVDLGYLFGNRLSEMLVPKPGQGFVSATFSRLVLFPLRWARSKFCEVYLRYTFPLSKYGLIPPNDFSKSISSCKIAVMPDNFFDIVDQGHITLCKSPNWHYYENGVVLHSGKQVEADVVITGTGFQGEFKIQSILPEYTDVLQGPEGVVPLYRGVVHPRIPELAFVGYQEDLSNVRGSELSARWISHFLSGKFKLPDMRTMERSTDEWLKYMKSTAFFERACVGAIKTWQSDDLCRDMGWNPRRKKGWLQELISPYSNMDYA